MAGRSLKSVFASLTPLLLQGRKAVPGSYKFYVVLNDSYSTKPKVTVKMKRASLLETIKSATLESEKKVSLVIFDKDGTLICFHAMWSPWARQIASRLSRESGMNMEEKVYKTLGFCSTDQTFEPGLLAESTPTMVKNELINVFQREGKSVEEANRLIHSCWEEGFTKNPELLKPLTDLKTLFRVLRNNNIKIAVCTSDSRKSTEASMKNLELDRYIDILMCGDDPNTIPKPAPHNALQICLQLNIPPEEALMVGDTKADVGMAKAAKLGGSIGVLSGVGDTHHLLPDADHVIHNVKDILPVVLPFEKWKECYAYSPNDRLLVEPHTLDESFEKESNPIKELYSPTCELVIFDLHGTLMPTESRVQWLEQIVLRLEQVTGVKIADKVYKSLGFCKDSQKIKTGIISDGTYKQAKDNLVKILRNEGYYFEEAIVIVNQVWSECEEQLAAPKPGLINSFIKPALKTLKRAGVKMAVSTCNTRGNSVNDLLDLGITKYIDMLVCGDDPFTEPKPAPDNVHLICEELNVPESETVIVGDSIDDISMGKRAEVKATYGVLSGIGGEEELRETADVILPCADEIISYILKQKNDENSEGTRSFAAVS